MLGPLWPTGLAIAPAALAARAAGTMPGGYCRNSGTWGSPHDAKVGTTPWAHQVGKQDTDPRLDMGTPSPYEDVQGTSDPGRGVGGLRVEPLSAASLKTRRLLGSVVLQAAGVLLEASSILKRIRMPTRALGARRLGLQEEGWASVLVGGGVSALPPPFTKG